MSQPVIPRQYPAPLKGMTIRVVGAGPGGLTFARLANRLGADVTVYEKASDPRVKNNGYTNRSFNLTLDPVGRNALGDPRSLLGGRRIYGRAIHNFQNSGNTELTSYGDGPNDFLVSIPRTVLRQNLVSLAEIAGVSVEFNTPIESVDLTHGILSTNHKKSVKSDGIVLADGFHSTADELIHNFRGAYIDRKQEPRSYVQITLNPRLVDKHSGRHLHFWREPGREAFAVGIPNANGSMSVLLISRFDDIAPNLHPFSSPQEALNRLRRDFPEVLALDPELPDKLKTQERGHLAYKSLSTARLGDKIAVIGDAAITTPPWAGFGTNVALEEARLLAESLAEHGEIDLALSEYNRHHQILYPQIALYVDEHGEFLNTGVFKNPTDRPSNEALADIMKVVATEMASSSTHPSGVGAPRTAAFHGRLPAAPTSPALRR